MQLNIPFHPPPALLSHLNHSQLPLTMARSQFPSFQKFNDEPATPHKLDIPADHQGPHEPISFMPQPSTPLMIMSSASRHRLRKSMDERAIRLLMHSSRGKVFLVQTFAFGLLTISSVPA
jgi:hypothetical protein